MQRFRNYRVLLRRENSPEAMGRKCEFDNMLTQGAMSSKCSESNRFAPKCQNEANRSNQLAAENCQTNLTDLSQISKLSKPLIWLAHKPSLWLFLISRPLRSFNVPGDWLIDFL